MWKQRIVLKHHPHTARFGGERRASGRDALAANVNLAAAERFQPGDEPQDCRLAGARWSEQRHHLAFGRRERYIVQHARLAVAEMSACDSHTAHDVTPARARSMLRARIMIGARPARKISRAGTAASRRRSSLAYEYALTASVSKLKGRKIRVAGSSFRISTNRMSAAAAKLGAAIGRSISVKRRHGPAPKVRADASSPFESRAKPASIGPTPAEAKRAA